MDLIKGLFPLLFAAINFFLLINLLIFGRKSKNIVPVVVLTGLLAVSQFCEFFICFLELNYEPLLFITVAGIWLAPVFVMIIVLKITGLEKLVSGFYLLAGVFFVTLLTNYGEIFSVCSLLSISIEYPSQWLLSYLSFAFLIIAATKLNFSFKNIADSVEIRKRRIVLYSLISTLVFSLVILLLTSEGQSYIDSILGKSFLFISTGTSFYVIREKYIIEENL